MNHESVSSWSQAAHNGPIIATSGDEDFSNFLELGLDFPHFDSIQDAQPGVDTPMGDLGMDQLGMDGSVGEMEPLNLQHNAMTSQPMSMAAAQARVKNPEMLDPSLHAQILRQHGQVIHGQTYQPQIMFPLTPHSSEMRGAAARFQHHADPQRGLMYDPNQMSFTPLVSPAYSAADYSANGEYFSPLTSPLLEAHQHVVYTSAPHSETGSTTSPVDLNAEYSNNTAPPTPAVRRNGRKPSTSSRAHPRSAKQSPVARGMSRRTQSSISEGAGLVQDSLRQIDGNIARRNTRNNVASTDGSGQDSVSPESLSDVLMPPPAIPRSAGRSPNITAQCKSPSNSGEPATPATLMRLEKELPKGPLSGDPTTSQPSAESGDHMEDIMLPESVASMRPTLEIDTDRPTEDDHDTPTTAAKTPKLVAGSTPRTTMMSPEILSPRNANAQKQPESKPSSRASKKRQSNSSAQISPALMPRISPSIKPLMPTSGSGGPNLSADASALYLATKSNYQNILEGTHLPGVSYPEALAENLSSKRTSHKIAEQGRRNRINTALKEIESLLPSTPGANGKKAVSADSVEGERPCHMGQGNSKASTVELAIVYIRTLQKDLAETKAKLEVVEKKLAEGTNSGNQTSG